MLGENLAWHHQKSGRKIFFDRFFDKNVENNPYPKNSG